MSFFQTLKFINNHPLAKQHKFKAVKRFLNWQISQKINPSHIAYPFIGNTKLWVKKGMVGATGNIYTGLHDFEDMSFLLHFLRPEDLFIDIGANVGSYTILAAGVTEAFCISIEPVPQTFEILAKNLSINSLFDKVNALNMGIGVKKGMLTFTKNLDSVNHVVTNRIDIKDENLIEVPCERLDDILIGKQYPALLKIDVEGFEQQVLNGAPNVLLSSSLKAIIIELNGSGERYGFKDNNIHQQLKTNGFNCYRYYPYTRELSQIENFGNLNTIYLKDIDFVKNRLKTAKTFSVFSEII